MRWIRTRNGRLALGLVVAAGGVALLFLMTRGSSAALTFERGRGLAAAGLTEEAADVYLEAIRQDPRYAPPYRALAEMSGAKGFYHVSADYWKKYIERAPEASHARCQLAYSQLMVGMEVPALADAEAELKDDARCARAHLIAGVLYARKSQPKKALEHLKPAADVYRDVARVWLVYGRVLALAGSYDQAEAALKHVLSLDKTHAEPYYWLAHVYLRRTPGPEGSSRARSYLRQALTLVPGHPEANYRLAQLLLQDGRTHDALTHASRAVKARKHYPTGLYLLAQIQEKLGNKQAAKDVREEFRKESRLEAAEKSLLKRFNDNPKHVETAIELGRVQLRRDNPEGALLFLRQAAENAPHDRRVKALLEEAQRRVAEAEEAGRPPAGGFGDSGSDVSGPTARVGSKR